MSAEFRGMGLVAGICAIVGAVTIAATTAVGHANRPSQLAGDEIYGKRLLMQTAELLGPDAPDPAMRFIDSRLNCASCHIEAGAEPGELSLTAAMSRYPRVSPRVGGKETIELRINGCMLRSMNGRALANDSPEMRAMVAWLQFLADEDAAKGASLRKSHDPAVFKTPARAANLTAGGQLFDKRCADCHGKDGAGLPVSTTLHRGYILPPLWGSDSFNDGAGMHRVLTAARFVKAKMPLGEANLSSEEAFDLSAYLNSKPRPHMANLERDYPDRTKKPVDTSYGPYADSFPAEQHQFGPFPPIEAYYKKK
jgi:thiosulfate dehydrogenase